MSSAGNCDEACVGNPENNLDVVKCADWIIDLGPEAGDKGGKLVYQGPPKGLLECAESVTAPYLKDKFKQEKSLIY